MFFGLHLASSVLYLIRFSLCILFVCGYTSASMKQKSHSGAKKRVRRTGSGKLAMKRNSRGHLLQQKNKRQKRMSRTLVLDKRDYPAIRGLLPHL